MGMIIFDSKRNQTDYFWGERTSTLDWCEENYYTSRFLAEFWNTFSSIFYVLSALYLIKKCYIGKIKKSFTILYFSLAVVGLGSMAFHATLKLFTQLLDELPMIYSSTLFLYFLIEYKDELKYGYKLPPLLLFANIFITYSYVSNLNPIFHQIMFGALMLSAFLACADLMKRIPKGCLFKNCATKLLLHAFGAGLLGFIAWNFDNLFCSCLRQTRSVVGWPMSVLFQLHAWWHILTAYGAHCLGIFMVSLRLVLNDRSDFNVAFEYGIPTLQFIDPTATKSKGD
ncbi:hypothetical protein BB560_005264 [Smittium megazygosporum]|uniref:Alkaline ceramidase n=1 Tax=Smittium megazygosporum TaxID=133381 RepID=A0A2T9Z6Z8_9FUNG|nr:hypothetical protein BB560_005264 [Smittium megazygosporum]